MSKSIASLQRELRKFAEDRDWGQFHSPKNLATALSIEAAELLEHFQWMGDLESRNLPEEKRARIGEEVADVLLYLLQLSDKLDIDVLAAANRKLQTNAIKYPVEKARGTSKKYTEI